LAQLPVQATPFNELSLYVPVGQAKVWPPQVAVFASQHAPAAASQSFGSLLEAPPVVHVVSLTPALALEPAGHVGLAPQVFLSQHFALNSLASVTAATFCQSAEPSFAFFLKPLVAFPHDIVFACVPQVLAVSAQQTWLRAQLAASPGHNTSALAAVLVW
jgi:hypothetical protein